MAFTVQICLHILYLVFLFLLNFRPDDDLNRSKYIVKNIKIIVGYLFYPINVVPLCSYEPLIKIFTLVTVFKLYLKGLNK